MLWQRLTAIVSQPRSLSMNVICLVMFRSVALTKRAGTRSTRAPRRYARSLGCTSCAKGLCHSLCDCEETNRSLRNYHRLGDVFEKML